MGFFPTLESAPLTKGGARCAPSHKAKSGITRWRSAFGTYSGFPWRLSSHLEVAGYWVCEAQTLVNTRVRGTLEPSAIRRSKQKIPHHCVMNQQNEGPSFSSSRGFSMKYIMKELDPSEYQSGSKLFQP